MDFKEFEKAACDCRPMPEDLSYPKQILYMELRLLYDSLHKGIIDKDMATRERKQLLETYRQHQFVDEMGKQWVEVIKSTELARAAYRKDRTLENADNLVLVLEGRNLKEISV